MGAHYADALGSRRRFIPGLEISSRVSAPLAPCYHRAVFFAPFLFFYAILFFFILAFFFVLIEIHIINYAFLMIGLPPEAAFAALLTSLIGSYINIPITRIASSNPHPATVIRNFGVRYQVPIGYAPGSTIVAVNVGGAIVPVLISVYLLMHGRGYSCLH